MLTGITATDEAVKVTDALRIVLGDKSTALPGHPVRRSR